VSRAESSGLDETHDPESRSWVETANLPGADFPVQNLPLGAFRRRGTGDPSHIGVAIGDQVLDLHAAARGGMLAEAAPPVQVALLDPTLNRLMAQGREASRGLRRAVHRLLRADGGARPRAELLVAQEEAELQVPADIGDYTDFYASIHHATNVGSMFRPEEPLLPNYKWVPIGYHGRASSVVPSGVPIQRPRGQLRDDGAAAPVVAPTRALDYECEVAAWIGRGNPLGDPIPLERAEEHLFGLGLLNDWSARDIQRWEYQPLGPFLAKNFGTTVSPWIVTLDALEPFRIPALLRPPGDPAPLPYLASEANQQRGGFAVELTVHLSSAAMRARGLAPIRLSRSALGGMYWTVAQLITHHASNGCNLRPGDLLGTGTISGPEPENRGCLLELTWRGRDPVKLPDGETRRFLEAGDEVILRGRCEREGFRGIGFGECAGVVA
jgi:fumarylacetoacetase